MRWPWQRDGASRHRRRMRLIVRDSQAAAVGVMHSATIARSRRSKRRSRSLRARRSRSARVVTTRRSASRGASLRHRSSRPDGAGAHSARRVPRRARGDAGARSRAARRPALGMCAAGLPSLSWMVPGRSLRAVADRSSRHSTERGGVIHARYAVDPSRPWKAACRHLRVRVRLTGVNLAANLETRLGRRSGRERRRSSCRFLKCDGH